MQQIRPHVYSGAVGGDSGATSWLSLAYPEARVIGEGDSGETSDGNDTTFIGSYFPQAQLVTVSYSPSKWSFITTSN